MFSLQFQTLKRRGIITAMIVFIMVPLISPCSAQHSGIIAANEIWMVSDNPHTVIGDITIDPSAVLTIDPGVEIYFDGKFSIDVQGEIYAVGAKQDKILFTATNTIDGWMGIKFDNTDPSKNTIFRHCIMEYGIKAMVSGCTTDWDKCGGAIYIRNYSGVTIDSCLFQNNKASRGGAVYILGIYEGYPGTYIASPLIQYNEFHDNTAVKGGALSCRSDNTVSPYPQVEPTIYENYIHDNRAYERGGGIFADYYAAPNITGNDIIGNIVTGENCSSAMACGGGGIQCCNHADAVIIGNLIQYNDASSGFSDGQGGGICCRLQSTPTIGNGNIISNNHAENGGGIYCENSDPVISACKIDRNVAEIHGGGIYCFNSSPQITNHTMIMYDSALYGKGGGIACDYLSNADVNSAHIEGNYAYFMGGGLYINNSLPSVSASLIRSNSASSGGGIALEECNGFIPGPQISGNKIYNNTAKSGYGGGLYSTGSNSSVVSNNFQKNISFFSGGAIFLQDSRTGEEIVLNNIIRNEAYFSGGGIFIQAPAIAQSIVNNMIVLNSAMDGGGIYLADNASPVINNNTISGNTADYDGGGIYYSATCLPYHTNTIIALNSPDDMNGPYGTYDYCWLIMDPGFVNAAIGDCHLKSTSGCVNAGTNAVSPISGVDMDGQNRFNNTIDIGADEYHIPTYISIPADYASIQDGIEAAMDFTVIQVEPGFYNEDINFNGKNITIESIGGPDSTVISGFGDGSVVTFANGETPSAVLRGFTIENGDAEIGGGIYISGADPTLDDLIIHYNYATECGGGIYCGEYSFPEIYDCVVHSNYAVYGGGMCIENSSPSLGNCTISENTCGSGGGGVSIVNASPIIQKSIISFNTAGEGVYCSGATPVLECVDIYGNSGGNWIGDIVLNEGINGNMEEDPLFCGRSQGIFTIDSLSPCAPDHELNQCGELIGAREVACTSICGDPNRDGITNISDAVYLINFIFIGGPPPKPFFSGDCNCDGQVNISDAVRIINYIFMGGLAPCDINGDSIPDC